MVKSVGVTLLPDITTQVLWWRCTSAAPACFLPFHLKLYVVGCPLCSSHEPTQLTSSKCHHCLLPAWKRNWASLIWFSKYFLTFSHGMTSLTYRQEKCIWNVSPEFQQNRLDLTFQQLPMAKVPLHIQANLSPYAATFVCCLLPIIHWLAAELPAQPFSWHR